MRLESANAQLREELQEASTRVAEGKPAAGDGQEGHWQFLEANLPWPLEFLRVAAPGESDTKQAAGDWLSLFRNAAPYIAAFREGTVVVHIPSFITEDEWRESFKNLMEDVAFCALLGLKLVLVTSVETRLWRRLCALNDGRCEQPEGSTRVGNRLPGLVIDDEALRIAKQE